MKYYNNKDLPCYNCLVKIMCTNPCDKIVSFLAKNLKGSPMENDTYRYVAGLLLKDKIILYPEETPLGIKYGWEIGWVSRRRL